MKNTRKESFLVYESFYEAIKKMPRDQMIEAYETVMDYGLYGKEPDIESGTYLDIIFTMAQPLIDMAKEKRENGKKGGKPKNNQQTNYDTTPVAKNNNVGQHSEPIKQQLVEDDDLPF